MPNKYIEARFAEAIKNAYTNRSALLIGNGINRISSQSLSWEDLLKNLIQESQVKNVRPGNKPLTFLFEEISHKMEDGAQRQKIKELKENVRKLLEANLFPGVIHEKFVALDVEHILTTNYDYCLEKVLDKNFSREDGKTYKTKKCSKKYSLTRCNEVNHKFIWHIHGELNNGISTNTDKQYPEQSIMLGFDQYSTYVELILKIFKSDTYERGTDIKDALRDVYFSETWLSFFFTHDIHIVGLELGLFESHLWWLFNLRAKLSDRNKCISNKIIYYVPSYELLAKRDQLEMLQSLKVDIEEASCDFNNGNFYEGFYDEVYKILKKKLSVN